MFVWGVFFIKKNRVRMSVNTTQLPDIDAPVFQVERLFRMRFDAGLDSVRHSGEFPLYFFFLQKKIEIEFTINCIDIFLKDDIFFFLLITINVLKRFLC